MDAILTIHSVDDSGSVLSIDASSLASLLERMAANGVEFTTVARITTEPPGSQHRVALTFDDGLRSVRERALPVLEKLGIPATVYVVSDWVGRDNQWPGQSAIAPRFELMGWDELAELREAGFDIGSHTANHVRIRDLTEAEAEVELRASRSELEDRLQVPVEDFAYPYGTFDAAGAASVGRWYRTAVTTRMGYLQQQADPLRLPRLDTYYLRSGRGRAPVFGAASVARLRARSVLRRVRRLGAD